MTLPIVIRIFFAIDLPASVKEQVSDYMSALKKKAKTNAIRWTRTENLHITLQFLPKVDTASLKAIANGVRKEVEQSAWLTEFNLGGIQLFPSPFRPRVIVLDVTPQCELANLATAVGRGVATSNYIIDQRPYRAHLTLARIKHTHGVNLQFLSAQEPLSVPAINLHEIVLFRSEPQPDGSRYSLIDRIPLVRPPVVKAG
jgi:RNA 2',3'-cyclic 3'-phosphodiesterase